MALLNWENKYSVNISGLDEQHAGLINLINSAHESMLTGKAHKELGPIFDKLLNYTQTHFALEEKYMEETGYEGLEYQKQQHRYFTEQVTIYKEQFDEGRITASIKIMRFLMDWLINHIVVVDRKYTFHFHKNGIK